MDLKGKSFLKLLDFSAEEIACLIDLAAELKYKKKNGIPHNLCSGKNIALIFEKTSSYSEGDYIIYQDGEKYLVAKITENELYKYKVLNENNETVNLEDKDLLAKVVYNNSLFSAIIKILINPITLVILLFVGTIFPELVYDK